MQKEKDKAMSKDVGKEKDTAALDTIDPTIAVDETRQPAVWFWYIFRK